MNTRKIRLQIAAFLSITLVSSINAQQIPEDDLLPCDESAKKALEEATPDEIKRISAYTPAERVKLVDPTYPIFAAKKGYDGWVRLSYVVNEEGQVVDPVIVDYEGHPNFKREALSAVKRWEYSPALKNGKPVQQCNKEVQLEFMLDANQGASRAFARHYRKAKEALDQGNISEAEASLASIESGTYKNRYENAFKQILAADIAKALKDTQKERVSLQRGLHSAFNIQDDLRVFDDNYLSYLYQRLFFLQAQIGHFASALYSAEQIDLLSDTKPDNITAAVEQIQSIISSAKPLVISSKVPEEGKYFHTLVRNQFAFHDINGKLETVEVRCSSHRESFTVAEAFTWNIPKSWGSCQVYVQGEAGTEFKLVEVNQV